MILQILLAALLLAEPAATPAAPEAPPPPTSEQVIARIDALLTPWTGKSGERLRGRLGLSEGTRPANDGEVVFWVRRAEALGCGFAGGEMRCGTLGGAQCRLGVAFGKDGKVKSWKAVGAAEACSKFLSEIGEPG